MTSPDPEPAPATPLAEGPGRWRESAGAAERPVRVTLGTDTLVIRDPSGAPLSHWVMAGIRESGPETAPVFSADAETGETLALDDRALVTALRAAARPRRVATPDGGPPPRRGWPLAGPLVFAGLLAAAIAIGPDLIRVQAERMMPPETAEETGDRMLLDLMERHGGGLCTGQDGLRALERIARPLAEPGQRPPRLRVLDLDGVPVAMLPGRTVVLDGAMVAEAADPGEIAGWIALALERDPVAALMQVAGPMQDLRYIFTGELGAAALARATEAALAAPAADEARAAADRIAGLGIDPGAFVTALRRQGLDLVPPPVTAPATPAISMADRVALVEICD